MKHTRVLPRDLFNDAKLIKCMGQLSLLIHDGKLPVGFALEHDDDDEKGFVVEFDQDHNHLFCSNLRLFYYDNMINLFIPYNSRENYPLCCWIDSAVMGVLSEDGSLDPGFVETVKSEVTP